MKRLLAITCVALLALVSLSAGALPYGLKADFTIDDLIRDGFELELDGDVILVTPPESEREERDEIISELYIFTSPVFDTWLSGMASLADNFAYDDVYSYISDVLGEGISEKNTRFFIERYSRKPSDYEWETMFFSDIDALIQNFGKYCSASLIATELEYQGLTAQDVTINMWMTDEMTIFTLHYYGRSLIFYVHAKALSDSLMKTLKGGITEALLDSF